MKYSLGIMCGTALVGCVFSACDVATVVSFDSSLLSSPYTQVVQYTMHVWSDIRAVACLFSTPHDQDDYNTFIHAIFGQLLCVDCAMAACDVNIVADDLAYLGHVVTMVKQEATALSLNSMQAEIMQQLFVCIEKKLVMLLSQSDDAAISACQD